MEHFITLLNDDSTWTDSAATNVVVLSPGDYERVCDGESPLHQKGSVYDLTNPVHLRMLADRIERNRAKDPG